jgi:CHRD domain
MSRIVLATLGVIGLGLTLVAIAMGAAHGDRETVGAKLTPGADVPKPKGASGASGSFSGSYIDNDSGSVLIRKLSFKGLTGPALQAHLHLGRPDVSGNVLVPLCAPCKSGMTGRVRISERVIDLLDDGEVYVNVHTKKNPAGEIRGQVKDTD